MKPIRRSGSALLAAGVLVIGLAACGDDDGQADADTGTDAGTDGAAGSHAAGDTADTTAFCDAVIAIDAAGLGIESGESTPEDVEAAMQAAEDNAPDDIADAVATAATEARAVMAAEETATPEGPPAIPGEAFYPAAVEISSYVADHCDVQTLDVTAKDYEFGGLDEQVPAGTTVINFSNDGTEYHEMVLVKLAEGEERPLEELLALPDDEVNALITNKAFALAPPGAGNYTTAELDAGRYVAICFVPVGSTPEALETGAALDDADGHFMHGMVAEFEVA
jgi:hypothetical protein